MKELKTSPTRPYIVRALYQWIEDNDLTPYLHVDATFSNVIVPTEHVKDGQIVLNISSGAMNQLLISNENISFSARFGGVSRDLFIPIIAVMGIYAKENGQGMFFDPEEYSGYSDADLEKFAEEDETLSLDTAENLAETANKSNEEKQARLEKAKKFGFRVIE